MRYLIGLDIDGTIITDNEELTIETIEYIKELSNKGHIVSLITGRPFRTTKPLYDELELNTPLANYSGSLLHHPTDSDFPGYKHTMNESYILEIFSKFKEYMLNAYLEIEDTIYLYKENEGLRKWLNQNSDTIEVGDFIGKVNEPLCGAVFFISPDISEEMENFVNKNYKDKLGFRHWYQEAKKGYHVVELYTLFASKATALEEIRKFYNIPKENVIAIGDGSNDLEMLEYAHYSAAMENAIDSAKKSAKSITNSNNENGAINYIKTIIK